MLLVIVHSLFLIVLSPMILVIYSVQSTILEPYSWNGYLQESGIYPKFTEYLLTRITVSEEIELSEETAMFREAVARSVSEVVTADWMENKVDYLQISIWDYMLGREERIGNVPIPEFKAALVREFHRMIDRMEKPEEYKNELLTQFNERVPSEIDIYNTYNVKDKELQSLKRGYEKFNEGITLLMFLFAALFLSGSLITFYPKWLFRWFGYTAIGMGIVSGMLYFVVNWLDPEQHMERLWSEKLNAWYGVVSQLAMNLLGSMFSIILITSIFAFFLGALAVVVSHLHWMEHKDLALRNRLNRNVVLAVRFLGLIVLFGSFSAIAFQFYSSF